jgi:ABC-type cobalamin/Fe3+-siderophores transport system ATPase subunit
MGQHHKYGKQLMKKIAGTAYNEHKPATEINYGTKQPARVDGTVCGSIVVEVESRTPKQIRGAVLDLICHNYPKKLLVILPVHMSNPKVTARQCRYVLSQFVDEENFRVVVTIGTGNKPSKKKDEQKVGKALRDLGWSQTSRSNSKVPCS